MSTVIKDEQYLEWLAAYEMALSATNKMAMDMAVMIAGMKKVETPEDMELPELMSDEEVEVLETIIKMFAQHSKKREAVLSEHGLLEKMQEMKADLILKED